MPKVDILNMEGSVVDSLELNDAVLWDRAQTIARCTKL